MAQARSNAAYFAAEAHLLQRFNTWWEAPQSVFRLEFVRIFAPLAMLGFFADRLLHADEWLGQSGFRVPDLGKADWRQPLYVPALPDPAAWAVAAVIALACLSVAFGWRARQSAAVLASCLAFAALSDRLAAFTVTKLSPVVALVLALSPCASRWSIDAWRLARRQPQRLLPGLSRGGMRFFQVMLPVFYCASGIAKLRGDWLTNPIVLWTHLHDSYQTTVSWGVANMLPAWSWSCFQAMTLIFETLAPLWFAWRRTRPLALAFAVSMHLGIGLLFGPVLWFSLLMITLLLGSYLPDRFLTPRPRAHN